MKDITTLAVRIAGLAIIIFTTIEIPRYAYAFASQLEKNVFVFSLPILLCMTIGIILFKFPKTFSDAFVKLDEPVSVNATELFTLGLKLVGFVLLFYALSDAIYWIAYYIQLKIATGASITIMNFDFPAVIATVVELLFALSLILKTKTMTGFVQAF